MWWIIGIALFLLLLSCLYRFAVRPTAADPEIYPFLFGQNYSHRGLHDRSKNIPENTLAAFAASLEAGYGFEFDLHISADGVPVVMHDADLSRMTGENACIRDLTLTQLRTLRVGGTEERIPTLEEVLALVNGQKPLVIEIKTCPDPERACSIIWEQLQNYQGEFCVESFDPRIVRWFYLHAPHIARGQLSQNYFKNDSMGFFKNLLCTELLTNVYTRPHFIAYHHPDFARMGLHMARRGGASMVAWTIRSEAEYFAAEGFFDCLIFENFLAPHTTNPQAQQTRRQEVRTTRFF